VHLISGRSGCDRPAAPVRRKDESWLVRNVPLWPATNFIIETNRSLMGHQLMDTLP
jgi:hypothetical protein